ncbi:benzoate 1,2-dioxygenase [Klebsiella pneumoniae subsp. pneumoniae]|uniref:Benzoate 1,2-dioxygenase n=1 Tax=Klebsiella pneumoniae subsp. pneumoniae TaxID=72407 RepID=A0A378A093_KLEPN|nr:benzoate 1,2-dioxygenase [Klebsiella pneumoniae subsp. pneumoniae]
MSNLSPDFTLPINFCANPQDAWTIPARFYTDSQAFEHEKERIFANSWICVAHGSEVARPNDYITREIIGENIVIVRGRDNILRAFYNVCPHRGHQLLSGEGKAKNVITCPYHAWAFKLDGNLAHARNCENVANFDSEKATLVPVRLEEYAGFVFINMNPEAESVETQLPGLQDKVLEACPDVHDLKLAARFTTLTRRTGKISSITIWNVTTAVRRTRASRIPSRLTATGTPCTANGRCSMASPNRPSSRLNSKRVPTPRFTVSGCGRAPCSTSRRSRA